MGMYKHVGIHVGLGMGAAAMYSIVNRPITTSEWGYTMLAGALIGSMYSAASAAYAN